MIYYLKTVLRQSESTLFLENFRFENRNEVATILSQIVSRSTTHEEIERIEKFAEENKINIGIVLEDAKLNLQWADKNVPIITDVLKQIH